jgi:hypothetical protein
MESLTNRRKAMPKLLYPESKEHGPAEYSYTAEEIASQATFDDIKHLILKNHDIDSCIEYLLDEYEQAVFDKAVAKHSEVKSHNADDRAETCREGLGEAMYRNGTELHEHLAQYVHMVAPDRFEEEAQEYAQEQE